MSNIRKLIGFGKSVKNMVLLYDRTIAQLAVHSSYHYNYVTDVLSGRKTISVKFFRKTCNFFSDNISDQKSLEEVNRVLATEFIDSIDKLSVTTLTLEQKMKVLMCLCDDDSDDVLKAVDNMEEYFK